MNEIFKNFEEANLMFLSIPRSKNEPPVVGISFANYDYPKELYNILHAEFEDKKFILAISVFGIVANLGVREALSDEEIFNASLNYDLTDLKKFAAVCSDGSSGAFVLGTFHNCEFGIVNPSDQNYKPFQVKSFQIDLSGL